MSKDIGIRITLPPDLKAWVDEQAEDIGANAAIWIRMLVVAARKQRTQAPRFQIGTAGNAATSAWSPGLVVHAESEFHDAMPLPGGEADPDAWRGPVDDAPGDVQTSGVDVDAIVADRVAEADAAGLTAAAQPYEAFAASPAAPVLGPANGGGARALRRPPPAFSPANQPRHLHGLV